MPYVHGTKFEILAEIVNDLGDAMDGIEAELDFLEDVDWDTVVNDFDVKRDVVTSLKEMRRFFKELSKG